MVNSKRKYCELFLKQISKICLRIWPRLAKNSYTPAYPSFAIQEWGSKGYTLNGQVLLVHI